MVTSAEILAVSTGLTWSVSALVAVFCWNCRRSRCTSLKVCGIEMVRDVMTADELELDTAPANPMNPPVEDRPHDAHTLSQANNPLWSDQRRLRVQSNNSDEFHDVERGDVEKQTVAH